MYSISSVQGDIGADMEFSQDPIIYKKWRRRNIIINVINYQGKLNPCVHPGCLETDYRLKGHR